MTVKTIVYPPSTFRGLALDVAVACAGAVGALFDSAIESVVGPPEVSHPSAACLELSLDGDSPAQGLNRGNYSSAVSMSAGQQMGGGIVTRCTHCGTTHGGGHKTLEHIACLQARLDAAIIEVAVHKEHRKVLAHDLSALIDGREPTTESANGVAQRIKRVETELTDERRGHDLAKAVVRAASKHLSFYEVQPGSTPTEEALYSAVAAYGAPAIHDAAADLAAATERAVIKAARAYAIEPNEHHKGRLLYHVCALRCGYPRGEGPDFECNAVPALNQTVSSGSAESGAGNHPATAPSGSGVFGSAQPDEIDHGNEP